MKALITGASSGIGKEIARYLAELGYDLILVSRSTDKLNKLKEELSNVNVRVITLDFSRQFRQDAVLKKSPDTKVVDIKIEKVFRKLFTQKGVKVTKAEVLFIAEAFRCYSTKYIKLYDGVLDLLDTLKAKGKKIYLLSNAQRSFTENELNMLDLTKYFDGICISSDEECSKPDEKYFKTLFDRYGLEKSESIMIGNDYISDIGGAADFGIDSLYIHQSISPEIDGELRSTYKVMDGDVFKIKKLIVK